MFNIYVYKNLAGKQSTPKCYQTLRLLNCASIWQRDGFKTKNKALVERELQDVKILLLWKCVPSLGPETARERLITTNNMINQVFGDVSLFPVFRGRVGRGGDVESG